LIARAMRSLCLQDRW